MQPLNALRGYSDFFKSGFRAFTYRSRQHSDAMLNSPCLTPKTTSSDSTERRLRSVSMIVRNTPREKARRRRTSLLSFSYQWFDQLSTTSFNETSTVTILPALNERFDEIFDGSIDPFSSSPDAKSTFIYLSQDDSALIIPKHDSFLSFTPSSNNRSSITTYHERPLSIQTVPLSSRQSSLQYEKSDFFRVIEEEIDLLLSSEITQVDHWHEDWDAPAKIDWRQFHVDVLTDDQM